jgi:hypothetical protein
MRYPILTSNDARQYLQAKKAGTPSEVQHLVRMRGDGPELDTTFVERLAAEIASLRRGLPSEIKKGSPVGTQFESAAAEVVHRMIPSSAEIQADQEFWIWLAVVHFASLIEWRYGAEGTVADLRNYGIGSAIENFLYRLWLRADLGLDEAAVDKYHLSRRGDIDFWRSHLFRQGYANAKTFAKALIRFQYPDGSPQTPRLKISAIRELVKRLRRARANLVFEILDESTSMRLINAELAAIVEPEVAAAS